MTYTPEQKREWQRHRLAEDVAAGRVQHTPAVDAFIAGKPMPPRVPPKPLNISVQVSLPTNKGKTMSQVVPILTVISLLVCVACLVYLILAHHRYHAPHDPIGGITLGHDHAEQPLGPSEVLNPVPVADLPPKTTLSRILPAIMEWLKGARAAHPAADPLLTAEQTRIVRVIQSAIVEHGTLIETAIREAVNASANFTAWCEPNFRLSYGVGGLQRAASTSAVMQTEFPYGDGEKDKDGKVKDWRSIQVDMIAFDHATNTIRAYEIKRHSDPSQTSATNLHMVQALLRSYARSKSINGVALNPARAETYLICYYSQNSGPNRLTRDTLDRHFGMPVVDSVEKVTTKFRDELQVLLGPHVAHRVTGAPLNGKGRELILDPPSA